MTKRSVLRRKHNKLYVQRNNSITNSGVHIGKLKYKVPRLFFAGDIGYIQCLQERYTSECKVTNERGKAKVWRGLVSKTFPSKTICEV